MRSTHIPVLAGELIDLLDPRPGQTAIDCTFGGGGHAELIAERLGPDGTFIAIDRDPLAEERFEELAGEVSCSVRFIRASYAEALELLTEERLRADIAYFDLGMSSMQVDTREGGVLAGISFHSLEDRRVKRFLTERARGCICPPEMPVCGCGREPEAALLARRAIMPSAGEVAHNPRSTSARLRAARKLRMDAGGTE